MTDSLNVLVPRDVTLNCSACQHRTVTVEEVTTAIAKDIGAIPARNPNYVSSTEEKLRHILEYKLIEKIAETAARAALQHLGLHEQ